MSYSRDLTQLLSDGWDDKHIVVGNIFIYMKKKLLQTLHVKALEANLSKQSVQMRSEHHCITPFRQSYNMGGGKTRKKTGFHYKRKDYILKITCICISHLEWSFPLSECVFTHLYIEQCWPVSLPLSDHVHVFDHGIVPTHSLQLPPFLHQAAS